MIFARKEDLMEAKQKNFKEIESVIDRAMKKVGCTQENELCKYLPMKTGGYMHHFTLKKMKSKQPQELSTIIEKFVIESTQPSVVSPKQRAPRGSRKRKDLMNFTKNQLERMLNIAKLAGDKEIISILSPKKSLAAAKRELIQAVRHNRTEPELWTIYTDCVNAYVAATQNPSLTN